MSYWPDATAAYWGALVFLGAFHGLNPGMGWLFAVALGMQENRGAAVWRALLPLGLGHACAVLLAIIAAVLTGIVLPMTVRWPIAAILVLLGVRRLLRHRHPRWGSMRMNMASLTVWSFLVATAHGAGLMVLPFWLGTSLSHEAGGHAGHLQGASNLASGVTAAAVHGVSYLVMTAVIAWIVFTKLGVELLRTRWINLDAIWAAALIVSGGLTLIGPELWAR